MTTFEIPAKGYAVLYRSGRDIVADLSAVKVPLDNFPSALANTGKLLQLFDGDKNLIDEVTYEKPPPPNPGSVLRPVGISLPIRVAELPALLTRPVKVRKNQ